MTLVWWEVKKLLKRRMTKVLLGVCLVLVAAESLTLGFGNYGFGTEVAAPTWEARARSVQATQDAAAWHGPLTPAVLRAARDDCRAALAGTGDLNSAGTFVQGNILYRLAAVLTDAGVVSWENWPAQLAAAEDETLDQFYTLWEESARRTIEKKPPEQQAALQALKDRVPIPFTYDWTAGHESELTMLDNCVFLVGLLLCAAVTPLFCGELRTGVYTIGHCARYGRGRLAAAKLAAALVFAGGAFAVLMGVYVAIQLAMFGPRGLSASVQIADIHCLLPLTLGQAEALLLASGLLSCLAGAAMAAAFSAAFENEFPALVALFAILVFLRGILASGVFAGPLDIFVQIMPFLTRLKDLTSNALLTLPGGQVLPVVYYQLAVQPLWLVILLPLAGRTYIRRQVG